MRPIETAGHAEIVRESPRGKTRDRSSLAADSNALSDDSLHPDVNEASDFSTLIDRLDQPEPVAPAPSAIDVNDDAADATFEWQSRFESIALPPFQPVTVPDVPPGAVLPGAATALPPEPSPPAQSAGRLDVPGGRFARDSTAFDASSHSPSGMSPTESFGQMTTMDDARSATDRFGQAHGESASTPLLEHFETALPSITDLMTKADGILDPAESASDATAVLKADPLDAALSGESAGRHMLHDNARGGGSDVRFSAASGNRLESTFAPMEPVPFRELGNRLPEIMPVRMSQLRDHGTEQIDIRLDPPELGEVRIHLQRNGETVTARIVVADPAVLKLIEHDLTQLRQSIEATGIELGQLDVSCSDQQHEQPDDGRDPTGMDIDADDLVSDRHPHIPPTFQRHTGQLNTLA